MLFFLFLKDNLVTIGNVKCFSLVPSFSLAMLVGTCVHIMILFLSLSGLDDHFP